MVAMIELWVLGALLYILGSVAINLGSNLVRLAHTKQSNVWWAVGTLTFLLGNVGNFLALGLAAQSLLEGLGSVQFVSNLFFANLVLGEVLRWRHILSTACITAGNFLIVAFGNHESHALSLAEIPQLAQGAPFVAWLVFSYVGTGILALLRTKAMSQSLGKTSPAMRRLRDDHPVGAVMFSVVSGLAGSNSVLLGKALAGVIRTVAKPVPADEVHGGDGGQLELSPAIVLIAVFCCALWAVHMGYWIYRLNLALKKYVALFIIPIMQTVWIAGAIMSGGLFFKEFDSMSVGEVIGFTVGLIVVFGGVLLLATESSPTGERPGANSSQSGVYEAVSLSTLAQEDDESADIGLIAGDASDDSVNKNQFQGRLMQQFWAFLDRPVTWKQLFCPCLASSRPKVEADLDAGYMGDSEIAVVLSDESDTESMDGEQLVVHKEGQAKEAELQHVSHEGHAIHATSNVDDGNDGKGNGQIREQSTVLAHGEVVIPVSE